jgi:hypothetical protein
MEEDDKDAKYYRHKTAIIFHECGIMTTSGILNID